MNDLHVCQKGREGGNGEQTFSILRVETLTRTPDSYNGEMSCNNVGCISFETLLFIFNILLIPRPRVAVTILHPTLQYCIALSFVKTAKKSF